MEWVPLTVMAMHCALWAWTSWLSHRERMAELELKKVWIDDDEEDDDDDNDWHEITVKN